MSTEQQRVRRLIVFPVPGSSGIWSLTEQDGIPQMAEHDTLCLPTKLSSDFNDFVRWAVDAASDAESDVLNKQFYEKGRLLAKKLAQFVGDSCQVEFLKQRILPDLDIEPLSREFVFGRRYTPQRNKRDFYSPFYRTYLATLLWCDMSEDDRKKIFSGRFDLGNKQTVPAELCTDIKLAKDLSVGFPACPEINPLHKPFKSVKEGIDKLLGPKFDSYVETNPSTTYKVIKLLYLMLRHRHNRLFHFLKMPDAHRYTLQFRDSTPFVDDEVNTEQAVWLIADLKTYLSLELKECAYIEIQRMFDGIPQLLENFRMGTEQVFVESYGSDYASARAAYGALAEKVMCFAVAG